MRSVVVCAAMTLVAASEGSTYYLADLNPPGCCVAEAHDINDRGQVVGKFCTGEGFLWDNGVITTIEGAARGINNQGVVVGVIAPNDAMRWESGVVTRLPKPASGWVAWANKINDGGLIVGGLSDGSQHGAVWQDGVLLQIGGTEATAVNAAGQVVAGTALWQNGTWTSFCLDRGGEGRGINDLGQVVGGWPYGFDWSAFMWENGSCANLGTVAGTTFARAFAINNKGQVVGCPAFIWERGIMRNLNDLVPVGSALTLEYAFAINDSGRIVGFGSMSGERHAFLLTPVPDFDRDGDVDLTDFNVFQACFNGPNQRAANLAQCPDADEDADSDVDLVDFQWFTACFNGPNNPPACVP